MFLHIGEDNSVPLSDVVCILNCHTVENYKNNESNKSAIILNQKNKSNKVLYSQISTTTLYKRLNKEVLSIVF